MTDLNEWADLHGEPRRMSMQEFEAEEARVREQEERELAESDYGKHLSIIERGEPYDLHQCVECTKPLNECYCTDTARCAICSVHAVLIDYALCGECDWAVGRKLYEVE